MGPRIFQELHICAWMIRQEQSGDGPTGLTDRPLIQQTLEPPGKQTSGSSACLTGWLT